VNELPARGTIRKIKLRLLVPLLALLFLSTIDRVNVSFAALQMNAELGLTPQNYGFGISIFFFGYILIQWPSLMLLQRVGMRRWLFSIALLWGAAATGMAFIDSAQTFYVLRLLLGIAEGGFAPGVMYYLAHWIPKRFRAGAISNFMLAVPISMILGGPLSGWLMSMDNPIDWAGWRWMLLIEGAPTIALALATPFLFADRPRDAAWLSETERRWIEAEIEREQANQQVRVSGWKLLREPALLLASLGWFGLMASAQALIFWLPQVIRHFASDTSDMQVGMLTALPWIAVGAGMIVNAWLSDRAQERYFHVALPALMTGGLLALMPVSDTGVIVLVALILAGLFMGGAQSTFWTIPPLLLGPTALASGFAIINMFGNVAGLVVPSAIGWMRARTGSFDNSVFLMATLSVIAALAVLWLRSSDPSRRGARAIMGSYNGER
jgi:ACS family tartrate transporter-like MFS transporter